MNLFCTKSHKSFCWYICAFESCNGMLYVLWLDNCCHFWRWRRFTVIEKNVFMALTRFSIKNHVEFCVCCELRFSRLLSPPARCRPTDRPACPRDKSREAAHARCECARDFIRCTTNIQANIHTNMSSAPPLSESEVDKIFSGNAQMFVGSSSDTRWNGGWETEWEQLNELEAYLRSYKHRNVFVDYY